MHLTIRNIKKYVIAENITGILHINCTTQEKNDYIKYLNVKEENIFLSKDTTDIKFNFLTLDQTLDQPSHLDDKKYQNIDYIFIKGCASFENIKSFLTEKDFKCVEVTSNEDTSNETNAFFIKKKLQKYLYCRPIGGFNNQLFVIGTCYNWCIKNKRVMILDTIHSDCCYNVCYEDFFEDLPCGIITRETEINEFTSIKTYSTSHGQYFCENNMLSTFDLNSDLDPSECNSDDLLIYIGYGKGFSSGDGYELFLKKLCIKEEILQEFKQKQEVLGNSYISIQVRNTDLKSDEDYKTIEIENFYNIHISTDDHTVVEFYKLKYGDNKVYNFSTLGSNTYGLHYQKNINGKTQFKELLIDLLLMQHSERIKSVSKGCFIDLARSMWNEKNPEGVFKGDSEGEHGETCNCKLCEQSNLIENYKYNDKSEIERIEIKHSEIERSEIKHSEIERSEIKHSEIERSEIKPKFNTITISVGTLKGVNIDSLIDSYKSVDKTVNPIIISTWKEDLTESLIEKLTANSFIVLKGCDASHLTIKNSINLQLCTIKQAIDYIKENNMDTPYLIKTRNDLYGINYEKIFDYIEILQKTDRSDKISVLSFFANPVEKLYFLDHFVMGKKQDMIRFFDLPYCEVHYIYPEYYFLMNYTGSSKFRLNYREYKEVFNFLANDFEKLGIDFVWDRSRGSESEKDSKNLEKKTQRLIKDNVCMYRELISPPISTIHFQEIGFRKVLRCECDSYFGNFKDDSFSIELSFIKNFRLNKSMYLIGNCLSKFYEVDPLHPKVYWIKKDITFINESLIKIFLKHFSNACVRLTGNEGENILKKHFLNGSSSSIKRVKQLILTLERESDNFYEINHSLQKTHSLVYEGSYDPDSRREDLKNNYFVYILKS